jgi:hypothetical protein
MVKPNRNGQAATLPPEQLDAITEELCGLANLALGPVSLLLQMGYLLGS